MVLAQGYPASYPIDDATAKRFSTLIKVLKGEIGASQNHHLTQQDSGDINNHKLVRHKRFLYGDNEDALDDWTDVLDDFVDYKRDLVDYWKEGVRTFIETFFPCGVTDTCDKEEDTPMMKKPMMSTMYKTKAPVVKMYSKSNEGSKKAQGSKKKNNNEKKKKKKNPK